MKNKTSHNGKLIYDYTNQYLNIVNEQIYKNSQKLLSIVAFSGLLIRFSNDLSDWCLFLKLSKVLSIVSLILSLLPALYSLFPKSTGSIIDARELFDEWWGEPEEKIQAFIVKQWLKAIDDLINKSNTKQQYVNWSLCFVTCGLTCIAINIILATLLPKLK